MISNVQSSGQASETEEIEPNTFVQVDLIVTGLMVGTVVGAVGGGRGGWLVGEGAERPISQGGKPESFYSRVRNQTIMEVNHVRNEYV
jgi:hypothetical protein